MDTRKGKINICVSIFFQSITMVLAVLTKKSLINICGNGVNGLNALFVSIIGFLSVAELGVGHAITYCMYKPIVEGDNKKTAALFQLFQAIYLLIGAVILVSGLAITPFLRYFAKDYHTLSVNIYATFLLMLLSTTTTYLFSAKTALINAYKNNYITTAITQGGIVFQYILQIITLYLTESFVAYLLCRCISVLAQWIATELVTKKKYGDVIYLHAKLDVESKKSIKRNIKAMFIHKIGQALVNSLDGLIISAFVGVVALGEYSNYAMILSSMTAVIALVFTSLTSVVGHLYVAVDKRTTQNYFECFHLLNYIIGVVFFLGYYAIIDDLVTLLFSSDLVVSKDIAFVITLNGFIRFMRHSVLVFKDACGLYYQDRWKPLFEGILNICLSIFFVKLVGVAGVLCSTILTNLLVCHIVEPFVLYRNAFMASPRFFFLKNYSLILLFAATLTVLTRCVQSSSNVIVQLLLNGIISLVFSAVLCGIVLIMHPKQRRQLLLMSKQG